MREERRYIVGLGDNSRNLLGFNTPTEEESTSEGNPVEVVTEPQITNLRK